MASDIDWDASTCDDFLDGSIYRVKLHNFLTYNDAEFYPGPRLNLILGPNGTGKSSIVCALCVGLAGGTKLLGRADKIGQFVRHEKDTGFTEIELYFQSGNQVIRRQIHRNNTSVWYLNGHEVVYKHIMVLMAKANIQIDNLCQFLPQDKVGEFSRMTSIQLLKATEQTVLGGELAIDHEQLIAMQDNITEKAQEFELAQSALNKKKLDNEQKKAEAERVKQHENRLVETKVMEKKRLWLEFEQLKENVELLKTEKKRLRKELNDAEEVTIIPMQDRLHKVEQRLDVLQSKKRKQDVSKSDLEANFMDEKSSTEKLEAHQSRLLSELKEVQNYQRNAQQKLDKLARCVTEWKASKAAMPAEEDLKELKLRLEEDQRLHEMEHANNTVELEGSRRKLLHAEDEVERIKAKITKLDDKLLQRRLALQKINPDCIRALEWVQCNRQKLKRSVWGPIVLEMSVKEPLHAKYMEDTLPKWLMTALVTECYEDYNTLIQEMTHDATSQRINVSVLIVQDGTCSSIKRPYDERQLHSFQQTYGISGYLDELVEAPEVINEVLRAHGGIHTVLVGTQITEDAINRGIDVFSVLASPQRKVAFVTPSKKYVVSVSKYGNGNVTCRTNDLQTPRLLAATSVNKEEQTQLTALLAELQLGVKDELVKIDKLKLKERNFSNARSDHSRRIMEIRSQLKSILQLDERIMETEIKIDSIRKESARGTSGKEKSLLESFKKKQTEQGTQAARSLASLQSLFKISLKQSSTDLRIAVQNVHLNTLQQCLTAAKHAIRDIRDSYKQVKHDLLCAAKNAVKRKRIAEQQAPWDVYAERFAKLSNDLDDLRACIENNKASLQCFRGDLRIREIYLRTCSEIESDQSNLEKLQNGLSVCQNDIADLKSTWHARLREVVSEIDQDFQESFRIIGCLGEIILDDNDEDLTKWGIQRRAQFRKKAKLSIISAEEQSGGEKSICTIMYLMALQSLTHCPFRVVDEINQGMDIHNERKVFRRITSRSCGQKLPQYFLITPKLITGLQYHRDTKVMFILNGSLNKLPQAQWKPKYSQQNKHVKEEALIAQIDRH